VSVVFTQFGPVLSDGSGDLGAYQWIKEGAVGNQVLNERRRLESAAKPGGQNSGPVPTVNAKWSGDLLGEEPSEGFARDPADDLANQRPDVIE
jgi:hypothetical protein